MIRILVVLVQKTRRKLPNASIVISYVSIVFYLLYAMHQFTFSIYAIATNSTTFDGRICIYDYFTAMYFLSGKVFTFIFYVARLYKIFEHTTFRYSKSSLKILSAFIIISYYSSAILFGYITIIGFKDAEFSKINNYSDCASTVDYKDPYIQTLTFISIAINLSVDLIVTIITLRYDYGCAHSKTDNIPFEHVHKHKNIIFRSNTDYI